MTERRRQCVSALADRKYFIFEAASQVGATWLYHFSMRQICNVPTAFINDFQHPERRSRGALATSALSTFATTISACHLAITSFVAERASGAMPDARVIAADYRTFHASRFRRRVDHRLYREPLPRR